MDERGGEGMYQKTNEIITISGGLHPKSNVEWLYLPRSEGGRGLVSIALYPLGSNENRIITETADLKPKKLRKFFTESS